MPTLAEAVKEAREAKGLSQPGLAKLLDVSPQSIQQLEAGIVQRPRYMMELSEVLGLDLREYVKSGRRVPISSSTAVPEANASGPAPAVIGRKDLPVYSSAQGGPDGMIVSYEPIEWVERPERLKGVPGAFAMYVVNDSMEPKYRQGDLLLIHPARPVRRGDSVLLIKQAEDGEHSAYIKELVGMTDQTVTLKQYNPARTFKVPKPEVQGLHLVIGAYWGG